MEDEKKNCIASRYKNKVPYENKNSGRLQTQQHSKPDKRWNKSFERTGVPRILCPVKLLFKYKGSNFLPYRNSNSTNLMGFGGEGDGTPLQYSCLENPRDGGAWWAAVHGVTDCLTQLSDFTFTFHFHALEKEMATHSNVLALRILGTEEPGALPSMGSHRVGHD